jgi:DNA-binding IclR family transcriptional regulator
LRNHHAFSAGLEATALRQPRWPTPPKIIRASGLPSSTVNVALFGLEMKRLVRQLPGKLFVRNV